MISNPGVFNHSSLCAFQFVLHLMFYLLAVARRYTEAFDY
jgi:hypothetical protein